MNLLLDLISLGVSPATAQNLKEQRKSGELIAHSDEISIELDDDTIYILNSQDAVLASMPFADWFKICLATVGHKQVHSNRRGA